ncbi:hypothetical protein MTR67_008571 [Solanum verrucosum]|uniref:RNase H type-1 domain-containing protein n=1 Tax=Solanum verrucosum TaxID=315347 RepID=A0AAF0TDR1_SOLVR|nr:hypothetical protein MTR67_008571 [Solanum verrucosum]
MINGDHSNSGTQIMGGTTNKTNKDGVLTTKGIGEPVLHKHIMHQEPLCTSKATNLHPITIKQSGSSKDEPIGKIFQGKKDATPPFRNEDYETVSGFGKLIEVGQDAGRNGEEKKEKEHAKEEAQLFHAFLNFDGASKGNPGLAGAGVVLRAVDGSVVYRLREGLGFATNNVVEYRGVILGLKYALEKGFKHIQVQGDSKLVCMQIQGIWKTTNQNMVELSKTVEELKDQFMSFHISHVERELNTEADTRANLVMYLERCLLLQMVKLKWNRHEVAYTVQS